MNRRRLLRIPPTDIGHAPRRGLIRVVGKVAESSYRTPITGTPCAAFVTELYEYGSGPSLLLTVASPGPLTVDDDTGRAEIAPGIRDYELTGTVFRGHFDDARASIETLLTAHGISVRNSTGSVRGISFVEHVLFPGDEVTAVGYARRVVARTARGGLSGGYRDVLTQVELGAQAGASVLVSDDPRSTGPDHAR